MNPIVQALTDRGWTQSGELEDPDGAVCLMGAVGKVFPMGSDWHRYVAILRGEVAIKTHGLRPGGFSISRYNDLKTTTLADICEVATLAWNKYAGITSE